MEIIIQVIWKRVKFSQRQNCTWLLTCTKTNLDEGIKLHEKSFARKVNFARVTILHRGSFFHDGKKIKYTYIYITERKKLNDKLI